MKFLRLSLAGILIIILVTAAVAAPEMALDQPTFDFGSIYQGKKVEHIFTLKNSGDSPLIIKSISPSCGCTAASISNAVIPPGTTGKIKSTFDSTYFTGAVHKTIEVTTNDFRSPTSTLIIRGTVIEEIQIKPKQLSLGKVKINETTRASLLVTNKGDKPLKLTSVSSSLPQFVSIVEKNIVKPGDSSKISFTIRPVIGDSVLSGFIMIRTDHPAKAEILVPVYGSPFF